MLMLEIQTLLIHRYSELFFRFVLIFVASLVAI